MLHRAWIVAALALLVPLPAFAVDGVVEISQTCAVQTGCFPSDTVGYPVTIGASGSYRLTSPLQVPADTNGIEITAEDVTLDLNGFAVRAPGDCSPSACAGVAGRGISSSVIGTRISNGIVRGFADGGIELGDESVVERVEARANGRVGIALGDRGRIQDSQASGGAGNGFQVGSHGAVLGAVAVGNGLAGAVLGVATGLGNSVLSDNGGADVTGGAPFGTTSCSGSTCTTVCTDADGDGAYLDCAPADCDDGEPASYPGNPEICDAIDNDCDGMIDEGLSCSLAIAACTLQFPLDTGLALGDSITIYGRVSVPGLTNITPGIDPLATLVSEVGLGAPATDPTTDPSWTWTAAAANPAWDGTAAGDPNVDEYQADVAPTVPVDYDTLYRFSLDAGASWTYCDRAPEGSTDGYGTPGTLQVREVCTDLANPEPECGTSEGCYPDSSTSLGDIGVCSPTSGSGTQGVACSSLSDCAPGFLCLGGLDTCNRFCRVAEGAAGCLGGETCVTLTPSVFVDGIEWGVCF